MQGESLHYENSIKGSTLIYCVIICEKTQKFVLSLSFNSFEKTNFKALTMTRFPPSLFTYGIGCAVLTADLTTLGGGLARGLRQYLVGPNYNSSE